MKKIFIILLLILIPKFTTNAENGIYIDGYDWLKRSSDSKISFIQGWLKCGQEANGHLIIYVNDFLNNTNKTQNYLDTQTNEFEDAGVLIYGVTMGQIIDTIDEIYSDARVKKMDITEIMPLVNGRLIKGWSINELDGLISLKVKLKQCENKEKTKEQFEEYGLLRKKINLYLENLKKK